MSSVNRSAPEAKTRRLVDALLEADAARRAAVARRRLRAGRAEGFRQDRSARPRRRSGPRCCEGARNWPPRSRKPRSAERRRADAATPRTSRSPTSSGGCPPRRRGRLHRDQDTSASRPPFDFEPKDHLELGEALGAIDMERGAKVSGARFYFLRRLGALLQLGLLHLAAQKAIANGFTPMIPPVLVKPEIMEGTGFLGAARRRGVPARGRRPLPGRHLRGSAGGLPLGRDPRPDDGPDAVRRLVVVLPPGGRHLRQGHQGHHPGAPVRQGRDVLLLPAGGRRGRAPAAAGLGGGDAGRDGDPVPGHRRRRRRPRHLGGPEVRLRGLGADPAALTAS